MTSRSLKARIGLSGRKVWSSHPVGRRDEPSPPYPPGPEGTPSRVPGPVRWERGITRGSVLTQTRSDSRLPSSDSSTAPTRARILDPAAIERKLALNTYNVDASRAHIRIIDHDVCLHCVRQQCINCCPANCYVPADDGRVIFSYEGCVECGTCRIVCHEFRNIEWTYPRGGFGIQYRYG
jgi:ferredoxin like protein